MNFGGFGEFGENDFGEFGKGTVEETSGYHGVIPNILHDIIGSRPAIIDTN